MALDMQKTLAVICKRQNVDLSIRIGMASGPVMAGVIGRQKFTYDVWGDAVNLASRLEGLSSPGQILVCPNCKHQLRNDFEFESRGVVDIKGVGPQKTWFLIARKQKARGPSTNRQRSRNASHTHFFYTLRPAQA